MSPHQWVGEDQEGSSQLKERAGGRVRNAWRTAISRESHTSLKLSLVGMGQQEVLLANWSLNRDLFGQKEILLLRVKSGKIRQHTGQEGGALINHIYISF